MKRIIYVLLTATVLSACGNSKENSQKTVTGPPAVNTAELKITEVTGTGKVQPEEEIIPLASPSGGIVVEVLKKEGDVIRKDEPLARLDDETEQLRVAQLKARITTQETQTRLEQISLNEAQIRLENKTRQLSSIRKLERSGAETAQNLDDLETEVKTLNSAVEKGMASVRLSQDKTRELNGDLNLSIAEAGKKILRSPFEGTLLEMHVKTGSAIGQLATYADVAPAGNKIVLAEVDELFADRLKVGLTAEIRNVGGDQAVAKGKVVFLSPFLKKKSLFSGKTGDQEDRLVREVKIALNGDSQLIFNSKVECVIKL